LNLPVPLEVEEDQQQRPAALILRGRRVGVASIDDQWEVTEEWWREKPICRRYYLVTTEDARRISLFRDLVDGGWYRQRA
jgi:hypothetical protein